MRAGQIDRLALIGMTLITWLVASVLVLYADTVGLHALLLLAAPLVAAVLLWKPPLALALFLFAGSIKTAVGVGPDLTVVLALIVVTAVIRRIARGHLIRPPWPVLLLVGFGALALAGVIGSPDPSYGMSKAVRFIGLGSAAMLGAWYLVSDERTFLEFAFAIVVVAGIISVTAVLQGGDLRQYGRLAAFGSDTIALGRAAALGFVGCATMMWKRRLPPAIGLPLVALFAWALVGSGNRAGVIGVCVALSIALIVSRAETLRVAALLSVMMMLVGVVLSVVDIPEIALGRYESLLSYGLTTGYEPRAELIDQALRLWREHPIFGVGTGGFASLGLPFRYPHNVFAEVLAENGLIGLAFYSVPVSLALVSSLRATLSSRSVVNLLVLQALSMSLINAMVASDINGHRNLYVFMVLGFASFVRDCVSRGTDSDKSGAY